MSAVTTQYFLGGFPKIQVIPTFFPKYGGFQQVTIGWLISGVKSSSNLILISSYVTPTT